MKIDINSAHNLFIASICLILTEIIKNTDESRQIHKISVKLRDALENKQIDTDGICTIVHKTYFVITSNLTYFTEKNKKLFLVRQANENGKEKIVTLIPGVDIGDAYDDVNKNNLWLYTKSLYLSSIILFEHVGKLTDKNVIDVKSKIESEIKYEDIIRIFHNVLPNSKLIKRQDTKFNPYDGIGEDNSNLSVDNIKLADNKLDVDTTGGLATGLGMITEQLGLNKGLTELCDQLKNISDEQTEQAIKSIKDLIGSNIDEATSQIIHTMMHEVVDEIKKNDNLGDNFMSNMYKIASNVSGKLKPICDEKGFNNPESLKKIINISKEVTKNITDKDGNKLYEGNNNPLSMLTNMMDKHMNMANKRGHVSQNDKRTMEKDFNDIMSKIGKNNAGINLDNIAGILDSPKSTKKNKSSGKKNK